MGVKNEGGVVCLDGWIVSREQWRDCGCSLCRMDAQNGGLTPTNINLNIFTTLMFYEMEFRMACREQGQKMRYMETFLQETEFPWNSLILFPLRIMCLPLRTVWCCSQCLCQTYQFLWADESAVVPIPSEDLQRLSLAVRSDQTHSLPSPVPPHSEVLSLPVKFIVWWQQYAVLSTMLHIGLLSRTDPYDRIRSGYFQGQII
jgi:hypothetical protein